MNDNARNDSAGPRPRRLYDRLRGWGGLIVGLLIGGAAFGASTAGAGSDDLQDPGGRQRIEEECAEGCSFEEVREWTWNGEGFLETIWAPPPPTTTPVQRAANP